MKNFPDHDEFKELEKRLETYTEQPDDVVWENINAALRPHRTPVWVPLIDGLTSVISILLFGLVMMGVQYGGTPNLSDSAGKASISHPSNEDAAHSLSDSKQLLEPESLQNQEPVDGIRKFSSQRASISKIRKMSKPGIINQQVKAVTIFSDSVSSPYKTIDENIPVNRGSALDSTTTLSALTQKSDSISEDRKTNVETSKRLPKRSHTFYFTTTPMLSFQKIIPVSRDGVVVSDFSDRPILSGERFGFTIEAGVQGHLAKRLEYYGGISFYRQQQTLRYSYQANEQVTAESKGDNNFTITPKSSAAIVNYDMVNLGLQAGVLYHLYGKLLTHKLGAGILFQKGLKKNDEGSYNNGESSYLSYQVFYRNELRLNGRFRVFIQPAFVQSIHVNESLKAPFNIKPYRAGLGFGVLYDF